MGVAKRKEKKYTKFNMGTGKPKKYVEAGPEWPHEELRFTSQTFGATSQKNMLGPKPKKYEWANAEKTSWGKCPKNKWNT